MDIGIDLGGTHIAVGLIENNTVIAKKEKNITKAELQNIIIFVENIIIKLIEEIISENNLKMEEINKVGIAVAGIIESGIIKKAVNLGFYNLNIKEIIEKYLNNKIIVRNDFKCAAMYEKQYGSLKNSDSRCFFNTRNWNRRDSIFRKQNCGI